MTDGKPGSAITSGWFMAMLLSALLAGCGGGGGGGGTMTTVSGTAASGKPIIGGTVEMVCFNNAVGTAVTTGADGGFTVTAAGSAPCVIRVSGGTNNTFGPLISVVASSSQTRVNVNQLTHMLAALLAGANPDSGLFQLPSSLGGKITEAAMATHKETIRANVIANLAAAAGIPTSFDFLEGTFTANSTGFDLVLDKLGLSSTAVAGSFSITFNGAPILSVNMTTGAITPSSTGVISASTLAAAGLSGAAAGTTPVVAGTVLPGVAGTTSAAATNPTAISVNPGNSATNVSTSTNSSGNVVTGTLVNATFSEAMLPATITPVGVFTLKETVSGTNVPGTVTMNAANTIATFTPTAALTPNTSYTAMVSTAAKNAGGTAIPTPVAWSFTTNAVALVTQAPVNLLSAGNFAILAKTQITDVPASAITGNIGVSPASGTFIFVSCAEMVGTGKIFAVDPGYVVTGFAACSMPGPGANKTTVDNAVADMGTARAEAAGRTNPDTTELGSGLLGGLNIAPGLHKWSTNVLISTNVTLTGSATDVWIFQIAGDLDIAAGGSVAAGIKVVLAGGAKASNVFWQVGGATGATLGTFSTFNGTILSAKQVRARTGAVVNGRLFADTQVTLDQNPVTEPAP